MANNNISLVLITACNNFSPFFSHSRRTHVRSQYLPHGDPLSFVKFTFIRFSLPLTTAPRSRMSADERGPFLRPNLNSKAVHAYGDTPTHVHEFFNNVCAAVSPSSPSRQWIYNDAKEKKRRVPRTPHVRMCAPVIHSSNIKWQIISVPRKDTLLTYSITVFLLKPR